MRAMSGELRTIAATGEAPVTRSQPRRATCAGSACAPGGVLLVHTSLSALGWVVGGAPDRRRRAARRARAGGHARRPDALGRQLGAVGLAEPAGPGVVVAGDPRRDARLRPRDDAVARARSRRRDASAPGRARCAAPTRRTRSRRSARAPRRSPPGTRSRRASASGRRSRGVARPRRRRAAARRRPRLEHVAAPRRAPRAGPGARARGAAVMGPDGRRWVDVGGRRRRRERTSRRSAPTFDATGAVRRSAGPASARRG